MNDETKAALEALRGAAGGSLDRGVVDAILAHIDGEPERLAAKAEEVREACAEAIYRANPVAGACVEICRATPLTARPLGDRLAATENERDHLKASLITERKWHIEALERAKAAEAAHVESQTNGAQEALARKAAEARVAELEARVLSREEALAEARVRLAELEAQAAEDDALAVEVNDAHLKQVAALRARVEVLEAELARGVEACRAHVCLGAQEARAERDEAVAALREVEDDSTSAEESLRARRERARAILAKHPEAKTVLTVVLYWVGAFILVTAFAALMGAA